MRPQPYFLWWRHTKKGQHTCVSQVLAFTQIQDRHTFVATISVPADGLLANSHIWYALVVSSSKHTHIQHTGPKGMYLKNNIRWLNIHCSKTTKKRTEAKSHLTEQESRHFHEILPHRFSYQTLNNTETQIQPVWAYLREDYKTEMVCSYPLGIYIYFRAQSLMGKAKIFLCSNEKSVDFG